MSEADSVLREIMELTGTKPNTTVAHNRFCTLASAVLAVITAATVVSFIVVLVCTIVAGSEVTQMLHIGRLTYLLTAAIASAAIASVAVMRPTVCK